MEADDLAAGGEADVELDPFGALVERPREGLERVLGRPALPSPAAVPEDDGAGQVESSSDTDSAMWRA